MSTAPATIDREGVVRWLRDRVPALEAVYLFGSALHGPWRPESDLDLAIDAGRPFDAARRHELALALAAAIDREVDLVDLRAANTVLRREILTTGERLFVRDRVAQDSLEAAMLSEYLDFNFIRQAHLADMIAEGRVHGR
jgi:predicted nucleotidyltransferase